MNDPTLLRSTLPLLSVLVLSLALPCAVRAQAETHEVERGDDTHPLYADLWIGGTLDSLYNAELTRLSEVCAFEDRECRRSELDTMTVLLAPVWRDPQAPHHSGWLVARLDHSGPHLGAALFYHPVDGPERLLRESVGDWGYGVMLPLADTAPDWIRLRSPDPGHDPGPDPIPDRRPDRSADPDSDPWPPLWVHHTGGPGLDVLEVYELEGRSWTLGPVPAIRERDGTHVELERGVYFVLDGSEGSIRVRPEIPGDMPCGRELDPDFVPMPEPAPRYRVSLETLAGPDGWPAVEKAYGRGC